jgi:hypothetical protein
VGGRQERVFWKGVAGEERVEERGWAYRRRQPEGTVLYEAVKDNLATLLAEASEVGRGLPRYVERAVSLVPGGLHREGIAAGQGDTGLAREIRAFLAAGPAPVERIEPRVRA